MSIHLLNNGIGNQFLGEIVYKGQDFLVGGTPPTQVDRTGYSTYGFTANDDSILGPLPITDIWKAASAINVTMKYMVNETFAANSGVCRFTLAYEALTADGLEAIGGGAGATLTPAEQNIPATALTPQTYTIGTILAANLAAGDTVGLILTRLAAAVGANPVQEPEVMSLHFKFYSQNLATQR